MSTCKLESKDIKRMDTKKCAITRCSDKTNPDIFYTSELRLAKPVQVKEKSMSIYWNKFVINQTEHMNNNIKVAIMSSKNKEILS